VSVSGNASGLGVGARCGSMDYPRLRLLFTLVTTSRSIGEITQLNIEVSKRCDPLYGELS